MTTVDDRCRLFFRHVFDDFEVFDFSEKVYGATCFIGPEASEKHLGSSRGGPGGHFGAPGGVWEASWGVLGGSRGHLGRVLGALGAILERP